MRSRTAVKIIGEMLVFQWFIPVRIFTQTTGNIHEHAHLPSSGYERTEFHASRTGVPQVLVWLAPWAT